MIQVKTGDRVAIKRGGAFVTDTGREIATKPGQRGVVLRMERRSNSNKKIWAQVDVLSSRGTSLGRVFIPGWWLEPKTVLDDLAEV